MAALITISRQGQMSVQSDDSNIQEIIALNDAILLLDAAKTATCRMALPIFTKVNHAHNYLCDQLTELL